MQHLPLPENQWADLREPKQVPEGLRRPILPQVMALIRSAGFAEAGESDRRPTKEELVELGKKIGSEDLQSLNELNDAVIVAMVEKWSFDLPVALDSLLQLPGAAYDQLRQITATFMLDLLPDFGPSPVPTSPTVPSAV